MNNKKNSKRVEMMLMAQTEKEFRELNAVKIIYCVLVSKKTRKK